MSVMIHIIINGRMFRSAFFLFALLFLSACSSSKIDYTMGRQLKGEDGLVFGRFKVFKNGQPEKLSTVFGERKFGVTVVPKNSTHALYSTIGKDGFFVWHFPAGSYTLASFDFMQYGTTKGRIFADFSVAAGNAKYIGDVMINFVGDRYQIQIADNPKESIDIFLKLYPDMVAEPRVELLKLEKRR